MNRAPLAGCTADDHLGHGEPVDRRLHRRFEGCRAIVGQNEIAPLRFSKANPAKVQHVLFQDQMRRLNRHAQREQARMAYIRGAPIGLYTQCLGDLDNTIRQAGAVSLHDQLCQITGLAGEFLRMNLEPGQ